MSKNTRILKKNKPHTLADADRVDVLTFGVGHGDCQLIEFWQQGKITFRLLYDGGLTLSPTLVEHLHTKRDGNKADLDIVVLSHVDADHRKGINELLENENISIGELWLPCLPAFRRLSWLFAPRVQGAVALAEEIEARAIKRNIPVIYPLEGHVHRTGHESALQISVISPARKLMKRLYSASLCELLPLLTHTTLPLEWLIRSSLFADEDNILPPEVEMFDNNTVLTPGQFISEPPQIIRDAVDDNARQTLDRYKDSLGASSEPEFFGQHQVNNTSLVLVIDAVLEQSHRRRIVLTGDQENWVWIASEHPMGLGADVMKAPHHGSRVVLSDTSDGISDVEQFWLWTRPRIVTVSANGKHSHPHCQFRESIRMIGAVLVCPNIRSKEWIFSDAPPANTSCSAHFGCQTKPQRAVQCISLAAHSESLDAPACLSGNGHRNPAPIVVMQQKLIEPDESFIRWTQSEVRKHARWLNEQLIKQRDYNLANIPEINRTSQAIAKLTIEEALCHFGGEDRLALKYDPAPVVRYAQSHGLLWAEKGYHIDIKTKIVAPLTANEYQKALKRITKFDHLLFVAEKGPDVHTEMLRARYSFLQHVDTQALMRLSARWSGVPDDDFDKHLKSCLFHDLIRHYQFRAVICRYGRYKQPQVLLHLYKKDNKTLPEFLPEKWVHDCLSYDTASILLDSVKMAQLIASESSSVFPPLRYSADNFFVFGQDINDFYQKRWAEDESGQSIISIEFIAQDPNLQWFEL
ncbi:Metallo-beta-lactamase superfamily protein [Pantoea ananatis]|uniref:MBL fold metallo-hydrolase n=1 Tax=Pantoea ananas TaxID=553 RepID=UPI00099B35F1|nr:MBL fold metallo-hydrolase [Pantoea ananatis]SKA63599.1 Metallo-beta-lactamase superfamily protein [Pantoea ananatis]